MLTSHRNAASRIAARVVLPGFRFVSVESTPLISNAKYTSLEGAPPQAPVPAVPFVAEEDQRNPIGWFSALRPPRRLNFGEPLKHA